MLPSLTVILLNAFLILSIVLLVMDLLLGIVFTPGEDDEDDDEYS